MRTLDILPLANAAPMADIDLDRFSTETGRAANIVLLACVLATTFTNVLHDVSLNRWLLLGAAPTLAVTLIQPMFLRRGLDQLRLSRESRGVLPFVVSYLIAIGCMKTIGDVVFAGQHPALLLQMLAIPAMLSWFARDAVRHGWMPGRDG